MTAHRSAHAILLVAVLALSGCDQPTSMESVDLLIQNAHILSLDENDTRYTSMAVRGERIIALGGEDLGAEFQAASVLDLEGATVMPGFNDSHMHIDAIPPWYVDLNAVNSIAHIQRLVAAKTRELDPGAWITGYGWSEDNLAEQRKPLRADLDQAAPNHPVMLTRAGAHSAVFNSRALELAGIDAQTPQPSGGVIERDDSGALNGIVREAHGELVRTLLPKMSTIQFKTSLAEELHKLFALGITSITEANNTLDTYRLWDEIYASHPRRLPRATNQLFFTTAEEMAAFRQQFGDASGHLAPGPIKIFVDGGFTGPAAFTSAPYKGEDSYRGALTEPMEQLAAQIREAHAAGWQLGIHAIGDAAITLTVDALAAAIDAHPRADHRHYLNHFTVMPTLEVMDKMARYGIAISQQPNFTYTLEGRYRTYLDGKRLAHNNPLATPISRGIRVAISSDILPLGPWVGIYAATTRRGQSGEVYAPEEKITRIEALRAYTLGGAWLNFAEHDKGTLEPGKLADFIVLDADPLQVSDAQLLDIQTRATYLGGRRVWTAP